MPDPSIMIILVLLAAAVIPVGLILRRALVQGSRPEREEELRTTLYSIGDAVISTDERGLVRQMNPTAETLTGWSEREAKGRGLSEIFVIANEQSRAPMENPVGRVLREGAVVGLANHTILIARDGTEHPIADSGAPIRGPDGSIRGVVLVFRDQSAERAAAQALEASREKYRLLVEDLDVGILMADPAEQVTFANPAAEKAFGVPRGSLAGRTLRDFLSDQEFARMQEQTSRRRTGKRDSYELSILRADGEQRRIHVTAVPQRNEAGEFVGTFGTMQDITENAELKQRLEEERRLLSTLIENLPDGVYMKDMSSRFILGNQAAADMMEAGPWQNLIGRTDHDFYPREQADQYRREEMEVLTKGRGLVNKREHRGKEGISRNILTTKVPFKDGDGRITGLVGISRDVSELARAREALEREHGLLSTLMESIPDSIYFKDLQSRFLMNNMSHARMLGRSSPQELIGKTDFDCFSRDHAQKAFVDEQRIIRTGAPVIDKVEKLSWPGRPDIWVSTTKVILRDPGGNVIGTFGVSRDITERTCVEEALQQSEEHFRNVFTNAPFGVFRSTLEGKLLQANPAMARMFGYASVEELIETVNRASLGDVIYESSHARARVMEQVSAARGGWIQFIDSYRRKDGQTGTANLSIRTYRESPDGDIELEGFVEDFTDRLRAEQEQKRLRDQLQQMQKMEAVGRLAGGIAHDFNNLLTVINGFTEMALGRGATGKELQDDLNEIKRATRRAATLTSQLLAFSRKQILEPRVLDLGDLVDGMQEMLKRLLGEDVYVRVHRGADLWSVLADPGRIEQVVMNLCVNSRDAMPEGGVLSIETSNVVLNEDYSSVPIAVREGDYVLLAVSDTGHGMSAEVQSRLFEPFFTTKEKGKGTGLGLSTVYGIVKQSDGYVFCSSESGSGTTFKIYLPRAKGEPQKVPPAGEPPVLKPVRGTEVIMLVEDDEAVRRLTAAILESGGYSLLSAASGREALQKLEAGSRPVDLLITDVVMPGMDGSEVAQRVIRQFPSVGVLYISGYTENAVAQEGVEFIQKPLDGTTLLARVRIMLDGPHGPEPDTV